MHELSLYFYWVSLCAASSTSLSIWNITSRFNWRSSSILFIWGDFNHYYVIHVNLIIIWIIWSHSCWWLSVSNTTWINLLYSNMKCLSRFQFSYIFILSFLSWLLLLLDCHIIAVRIASAPCESDQLNALEQRELALESLLEFCREPGIDIIIQVTLLHIQFVMTFRSYGWVIRKLRLRCSLYQPLRTFSPIFVQSVRTKFQSQFILLLKFFHLIILKFLI